MVRHPYKFYKEYQSIRHCKVCGVMYRPVVGSPAYILKLCWVHRKEFHQNVYQERKAWLAAQPIYIQEQYREKRKEWADKYYLENQDRIIEQVKRWWLRNRVKINRRHRNKAHNEKYLTNKGVAKRTKRLEMLQRTLGVII